MSDPSAWADCSAAAAAAASPAALREPDEGFGSSVRISLYGSSAEPSDASAGITAFVIMEIMRAADKISASFFLIILFLPLCKKAKSFNTCIYYHTNYCMRIVCPVMSRRFLNTNGPAHAGPFSQIFAYFIGIRILSRNHPSSAL